MLTKGKSSCGKIRSLIKESASCRFDVKEEVLSSIFSYKLDFHNILLGVGRADTRTYKVVSIRVLTTNLGFVNF